MLQAGTAFIPDVLPIVPARMPDELLSSWVSRIESYYGVFLSQVLFQEVFEDLTPGYSHRLLRYLDVDPPKEAIERLASLTRRSVDELAACALVREFPAPDASWFPISTSFSASEYPSSTRKGYLPANPAICPDCAKEMRSGGFVYDRRAWALTFLTMCVQHRRPLVRAGPALRDEIISVLGDIFEAVGRVYMDGRIEIWPFVPPPFAPRRLQGCVSLANFHGFDVHERRAFLASLMAVFAGQTGWSNMAAHTLSSGLAGIEKPWPDLGVLLEALQNRLGGPEREERLARWPKAMQNTMNQYAAERLADLAAKRLRRYPKSPKRTESDQRPQIPNQTGPGNNVNFSSSVRGTAASPGNDVNPI